MHSSSSRDIVRPILQKKIKYLMHNLLNRTICGDCLSVSARIPDGSVDLVVTDPPYEIEDRWRLSMQGIIYATKGHSAVFNEDEVRVEYTEAAKKLHGRIRPSAGRLGEPAPYDTSRGALPRDVIDCPALLARERVGHPDQKPPVLVEKLVKASSVKEDVVLDMFSGSGATLVAAKRLGRRYVGIELLQKHVGIIKFRLKTGN